MPATAAIEKWDLFEAAFELLSLAQRRQFFQLPEIVELLDNLEYRELRGLP